MKSVLKLLFVIIIMLPAISDAQLPDIFGSGTSEGLQHDFDITRLKDLGTLSGYLEKYHETTGKYPFQGEVNYPHYVYVATLAI